MSNQGHKVLWANPEALLPGRFHLCAVSCAARKYALVYVRPSSSTPLSNSSLTTATSDCTSRSACRHYTKEEYDRVPRKWTSFRGNIQCRIFISEAETRQIFCALAKSRFLPVFPLLATGTVCCSKQVPFQSLGKWNTLKTVASSKCQSCATGITQGRIMVPCPVGIVASLP